MKFTIKRTAFMNQLNNVSRAISSKSTIPILLGIKMTATEEGITLVGSDTELSIEGFLPIKDESLGLSIESTGSVVVTSRYFLEVIRKLPADTVTVEVNDQAIVNIQSGQSHFTLNGIDGNQYPLLPEIISEESIQLPTELFKELIAQTIISTSNQETRPILTGVNITLKGKQLTGVATDSHRLSQRTIEIMNDQELEIESMTIPKKTLNELSRIVEDEDHIKLIISDEQLIFALKNLTIYSRILEGNYPDTARLIPTEHATRIVVNADTFYHAIDRASIMSNQGKNNVVRLEIEDQRVELSVYGSQLGSSNEAIETQTVTGESLQISFNPDYMKDALKTFNETDIQMDFQSNVRPILLTAVEDETSSANLIQLLTPIRTH